MGQDTALFDKKGKAFHPLGTTFSAQVLSTHKTVASKVQYTFAR
jgi:hypothetical protein